MGILPMNHGLEARATVQQRSGKAPVAVVFELLDGLFGEVDVGEVGTVAKVMDGELVVEFRPSACCAGCEAIHACFLGDDKIRRARVRDHLGARVGDSVEVALKPNALIKASLLIYIVPLIGLFVGLLLGQRFSAALEWSLPADAAGIIFGFGFLAIALVCIRLLSSRLERSRSYELRVTRIVARAGEDAHLAGVSTEDGRGSE